jgi:hypothetical protein
MFGGSDETRFRIANIKLMNEPIIVLIASFYSGFPYNSHKILMFTHYYFKSPSSTSVLNFA